VTNTIFLIRHGQTVENAVRTVQLPDASLSRAGMAQARLLAERLTRERIAHILSSDLVRACETAEYLRRATGADIEHEPLLRERDFGDIRGSRYDDLGFDMFAPDYSPPRGETWGQFHDRVDQAVALIDRVAAGLGGPLAVVTHGLVCHSIAERHLQLPNGEIPHTEWNNTSLTIIERRTPWRARLVNCTAHLGDFRTGGRSPG
jgi:2,3-bisphosphoglycerate-dependent phosphoglycerate mutase